MTPGVRGIGTASFLADLGHEVPTALLPSFLTSTLGAPAYALGLIEGVSDGLANASSSSSFVDRHFPPDRAARNLARGLLIDPVESGRATPRARVPSSASLGGSRMSGHCSRSVCEDSSGSGHADLTILAELACALSRGRAVPLAA